VEWGKDVLARLTRKRRSTLPPGYAIKHLVFGQPAAGRATVKFIDRGPAARDGQEAPPPALPSIPGAT